MAAFWIKDRLSSLINVQRMESKSTRSISKRPAYRQSIYFNWLQVTNNFWTELCLLIYSISNCYEKKKHYSPNLKKSKGWFAVIGSALAFVINDSKTFPFFVYAFEVLIHILIWLLYLKKMNLCNRTVEQT